MSAIITTLEAPALEANDATTSAHALTTSPATVAPSFSLNIDYYRPCTITHSVTDGTHSFKVEQEEAEPEEAERSWLK